MKNYPACKELNRDLATFSAWLILGHLIPNPQPPISYSEIDIYAVYRYTMRLYHFSQNNKYMVNVLKFQTLSSFCSQIKHWFIRAGTHKRLVRKANREDPDQIFCRKQLLLIFLEDLQYILLIRIGEKN